MSESEFLRLARLRGFDGTDQGHNCVLLTTFPQHHTFISLGQHFKELSNEIGQHVTVKYVYDVDDWTSYTIEVHLGLQRRGT